MRNNEIKLTDEQIILSYISIGTIIISIILLFNNKSKIINNKGFIKNGNEHEINVANKIILLFIFYIFAKINYNKYIEAKNAGKEDYIPYQLQFYASILIVISAIIVLYVSIVEPIKDDDIENPTI